MGGLAYHTPSSEGAAFAEGVACVVGAAARRAAGSESAWRLDATGVRPRGRHHRTC